MSTPIVLVSLGPTPSYLADCISYASRFHDVILLTDVDSGFSNQFLIKDFISPSSKSFGTNRCSIFPNFGLYTSLRFLVLHDFSVKYNIPRYWHIENDVALLQRLPDIPSSLALINDCPHRVVPSACYFDGASGSVYDAIVSRPSEWDMDILASLDFFSLPTIPAEGGFYDGAALGQFLFGPDPVHGLDVGFVNESSLVTPASYRYHFMGGGIFVNGVPLFNIHLHCKNFAPLTWAIKTSENIGSFYVN